MKPFRRYISLLLALALLATGHSAAASRFARDATGQVILCTGTGPVTVYVDAEGQPVGPPHICPDCITHLFDLASAPPLVIPAVPVSFRQAPPLAPRAQHDSAPARTARARAPPSA
ncbi:hypothetical protein [Phaeobacter sp. HF9A]|uniref:hypothetical protein n=1 Tax=Phaeobacter sp. HF9A TaxID=2721561 RepID=UPI00143169DF|nr:hypothetical protein [Phaeobacter sp. HF9A]NIZ14418.1 hypothetical protein [Phaeobacter sp. HF9A]